MIIMSKILIGEAIYKPTATKGASIMEKNINIASLWDNKIFKQYEETYKKLSKECKKLMNNTELEANKLPSCAKSIVSKICISNFR